MKYEMSTASVTDETTKELCKNALASYAKSHSDCPTIADGADFTSLTIHHIYRGRVSADFVSRHFKVKSGGTPVAAPVGYDKFDLWDIPVGEHPENFDKPLPQTCKDEKCHSCDGTGHEKCGKCHGEGHHKCDVCHGEKKVACDKCNGKGQFKNCSRCDSTGKMECPDCEGTGKNIKLCPVCHRGKVTKKRMVPCRHCKGTGTSKAWHIGVSERGIDDFGNTLYDCEYCRGMGKVEESYKDYCPACHGDYKKYGGTCNSCAGTGKVECTRCHGTGHAKCSECGGSGKISCSHCNGKGTEQCTECHGRKEHVCGECKGKGSGVQTLHIIQKVTESQRVRIWGDDETPDCLIPLKYTKFEDVEIFSKSSDAVGLDNGCMPEDFSSSCPLMRDLWTLSAKNQYEEGKVRFSKQNVYLSKSPSLIRCVFKNDTGRHEAWVSRETGELLLIDGSIVSRVIEELQKEKAEKKQALPADVLLAAEQGMQSYDEGKFDVAMPLLKKAAEGGHAKARYYYAKCLLKNGSTDEAVKMIKEGAAAGGSLSMTLLGDLYAQEKIKLKDPKKKDIEANKWYEKAVEKGSAEAMGALGENLRTGAGIEKNINRAFILLCDATAKLKGSAKAKAIRRIAHMYRDGVIGETDRTKANQLYCRAANIGDGWSLYEIGRTYFEGLGVEKNLGEARRLLELAEGKKNKEAGKLLAKIPKSVSLATDCPSGVTGVPGKGPLPDFVLHDYEIAKAGKLWRGKDGKVVKTNDKKVQKESGTSAKKRWKFVLIGIFFGLFGLHFLYARRKGWFAFYWLMLIANIVHVNVPAVANLVPALAKVPIFGVLATLIFVGSIFFMKKDGDGNRM